MATTTQISDSLIGSLCRDMAAVRQSWNSLQGLLSQCRDERLRLRLGRETTRLQLRRLELQHQARAMTRLPLRDPLGAAFLLELTSRALSA
jgi:ABC-type protease/lipase transport system fused ATPase/permease subunit